MITIDLRNPACTFRQDFANGTHRFGAGTIADAFQTAPGKDTAWWVAAAAGPYYVTILETFPTVQAARLNVPKALDPNRRVITCNDGRQFETIRAAAEATGCSMSGISNNLNGVPGYGTVKGFKFTREVSWT